MKFLLFINLSWMRNCCQSLLLLFFFRWKKCLHLEIYYVTQFRRRSEQLKIHNGWFTNIASFSRFYFRSFWTLANLSAVTRCVDMRWKGLWSTPGILTHCVNELAHNGCRKSCYWSTLGAWSHRDEDSPPKETISRIVFQKTRNLIASNAWPRLKDREKWAVNVQ